jgi:predicted ribosome quality control (RQC) complex YloA/Tae2 family protein
MKGGEAVDILPFPLRRYDGLSCVPHGSYNAAMDAVLTEKRLVAKQEERQKTEGKAKDKAQAIIDAQTKQLERMRQEAESCQRAGELIYERYHLVEEVLRELKVARERHSWKEIKERLKGHRVVKEIDEKTGKVTIEL